MTTPHGSAPDGAWQFASGFGQGMTEDEALALATGGARGNLEQADEEWALVRGDLQALIDEQDQFKERLDLLEGVYGYCNTFMSANWLVAQDHLLALPFDTQLGPNVGAVPYEGGIRLQTRGLWRADTIVTCDKMTSSNFAAQVYITVLSVATGAVYSETRFDIVLTPSGSESAAFSKTFVVPTDDDYVVKARIQHNRTARLRVFGGTLRSALSVNKWSTNTSNNVDIPEPADGGELG
ncbi:hypothetical protein BO226_17400 [Rhodococcus sp. 2G]|uniref:hypothetical protein n=1 Tax=Rhodococcus sp. 2G TaxID=1570939 RepID=UPI000903DC1B|nr:hypothetical protein [Rhodococcus sp. 2G]APE10752.1 hypothetical protein BO226_17400 [Rhodococcus sp. 2G]